MVYKLCNCVQERKLNRSDREFLENGKILSTLLKIFLCEYVLLYLDRNNLPTYKSRSMGSSTLIEFVGQYVLYYCKAQ